ncbi:MAG: ABC transporter ATP-binding protein, partial [Gaiellaceae bacterium]
MAEVELVKVTKRYGTVTALSELDFHINDGEFVTLLGPSGCGKTTALNLIAGLDEVTSGQILIGGIVVNELTPFERDVAMVFQSYALYPHMTVADYIGFTLKLRKRPKAEIRGRVAAVAEMLELAHLLDRRPRELSGGQQQRVALGRAVIREPRIFLFDEPFSNLDAALRVRMRMEIKELHQQLKITSLFVTHDQEEALSISDRIAIMRNGRIEQVGTSEEVYGRPRSKYVARFIGSPPMDIFEGAVEREAERLYYRVGSGRFEIPASAVPEHDGAMDLGVRPEHVAL